MSCKDTERNPNGGRSRVFTPADREMGLRPNSEGTSFDSMQGLQTPALPWWSCGDLMEPKPSLWLLWSSKLTKSERLLVWAEPQKNLVMARSKTRLLGLLSSRHNKFEHFFPVGRVVVEQRVNDGGTYQWNSRSVHREDHKKENPTESSGNATWT